jgi:hypothetical protein
VGQSESDEAEKRPDPDPGPRLVLRFLLAARDLGVHFVDADRDAALAADALGESDVIDVRVREHDRAHVGERPTHRRELAGKIFPVRRCAAVDDRYFATLLEEV